jgi:hypothetical protein
MIGFAAERMKVMGGLTGPGHSEFHESRVNQL